jgi:phosphopantetheinyl transferase
MPDKPTPMTPGAQAALIGEPFNGALAAQRATLDALLLRSGWDLPTRLPNGKPVLEKGYCSLSHGGGWVIAGQSSLPIGIDVEAPGLRLQNVRRRFVGPADQPVLDAFGDNIDTLCMLWTAKEAAFKVFGTGLDFLTGLEWREIRGHSARARATTQGVSLEVTWNRLSDPKAWLAIALQSE